MSNLTREAFTQIVTAWQTRLELTNWRIALKFETNLACVDPLIDRDDLFDEATLTVPPTFTKWERAHANVVAVHELLHLHMRDLDQAAKASADLLGRTARTLHDARYEHENEGVIDRIAKILVACVGEV